MAKRQVKFARDRRKRKARIKAGVFFVALLSIFAGIMLSINSSPQNNDTVQTTADGVQYQPLENEPEISSGEIAGQPETPQQRSENEAADDHHSEQKNGEESTELGEATSYDEDLQGPDDESEEIAREPDEESDEELPKDAQSVLDDLLDIADQALKIKNQFSHTVVRGDKLADILELSGLDDSTANKLIADYPELKRLTPGQQFYWILNKDNELEYMNWLTSEKEERIYELTEEGKYIRQILEKKSIWKKEVLKGQVGSSFNGSLKQLGLTNRQIAQLTSALQWQVSMRKLKKGDRFAVLISREYLAEKLTGQGNVEGIHMITGGKSYYAIQAANGRYYSRHGETLGKGFARYPLQRQARISSHFNPRRRHPITKRIKPHNGVDFALPTGTPIIAPADGIVAKVAYQAHGAGRYIVIRHGREYETVYMHLSRPLVRAGQNVKRGDRIALSGNTGGSTGPHLHYEFHINGRPVNPITVKLPGGNSGMSTAERRSFLATAKTVESKLRM